MSERGRPRDSDVDRRIIDAARQVYLERGWAGFNFGAVCKAASVSKDAMYRRYAAREDLLVAALTEAPIPVDFGSGSDFRSQLITIAELMLAAMSQPEGLIGFRLFVDAATNPEMVAVFYEQITPPHIRYLRDLTRTAIDNGLLTAIDNPTAFIDGLLGGLFFHVVGTPPQLRDVMLAKSGTFVREHVDLILRGAGYVRQGTAVRRE